VGEINIEQLLEKRRRKRRKERSSRAESIKEREAIGCVKKEHQELWWRTSSKVRKVRIVGASYSIRAQNCQPLQEKSI
jgi:hypothetical protein